MPLQKRRSVELHKIVEIARKSSSPSPQLLRVKDCYANLGYPSIFSMYRAIRLNQIPAHRHGGRILVDPAEVRSAQRTNLEVEQAIKDLFSDVSKAVMRFLEAGERKSKQEEKSKTYQPRLPTL